MLLLLLYCVPDDFLTIGCVCLASLLLLTPMVLRSSLCAQVNARFPEIHILVNNAGAAFMARTFTEDGVGGIAQTNHLGRCALCSPASHSPPHLQPAPQPADASVALLSQSASRALSDASPLTFAPLVLPALCS